MNPQNPSIPPIIPSQPVANPAGAENFQPISGFGSLVDALLRTPRRVAWHLHEHPAGALVMAMVLLGLLGAGAYGLVVGSFAGGHQLWIAPAKITGGLVVSALICLPSLFIFTVMNGSRARFIDVCGLLAGFIALTTLLLIGFAPVAWIFSVSTESPSFMGALHLAFWITCAGFGLRFLGRGLESFGMQPGGMGLVVWSAIFLLVSLQMTCALRPIISGDGPFFPQKKMFFLSYWSMSSDEGAAKPLGRD